MPRPSSLATTARTTAIGTPWRAWATGSNANRYPGITGIDTRALTKALREHGVMMGKIVFDDEPDNIPTAQYAGVNYVDRVSCKEVIRYNEGSRQEGSISRCGVKANILRCLINRGVEVIRVPWGL